MKLATLFKHLVCRSNLNFNDVEISGISDDSRIVKAGDLFFARTGFANNRLQFAKDAIAKGAVAVVSDSELEIENFILVEDCLETMEAVLKNFYESPLDKLVKYAVTGTNGKTTVAYIVDHVLNSIQKTMLTGTIENRIAGQVVESQLTTPGMIEFYQLLKQGVDQGCKSISLELSSHAIDQNRLGHIRLDAAVFTNLTQDHLDYHGDMESYFQAKLKMFQELLSNECIPVINLDDPFGERITKILDGEFWTYGLNSKNYDIAVVEDLTGKTGIHLKLQTPKGPCEIETSLIGDFNKENLLGAVGSLLSTGISVQVIEASLKTVHVPGRLELVSDVDGLVVVDYAHTPDALARVMTTLKANCKGQLITVFGCGGDRDNSKRSLMGSAAAELSDVVLVTSDNPRTENPTKIIDEILMGIPESKSVFVEPDRKMAIGQALGMMSNNDIVLIAGKGHEDYQIIGTEKFHFDDKEIVEEFIGGLGGA